MLDFPKLPISNETLICDSLDELHFGSNSLKWDSAACICPMSGTILHFLSLDPNKDDFDDAESVHSLIAIQGGYQTIDGLQFSSNTVADVIKQSRRRLTQEIQNRQIFRSTSVLSNVESRLRGVAIRWMQSMGKQLSSSWILGNRLATSHQPVLLDFRPWDTHRNENDRTIEVENKNSFQLRELAVPFFPEMSSLQQQLSRSHLSRPIPGLYQYSNLNETKTAPTSSDGLIIRPLPSASEDFRLSPPSLVCQCRSLSKVTELVEKKFGGTTAKIGWRGDGQNGSLIVSHPSMKGLDIRFVETRDKWVLNSYFDEAQEALLAASLEDLQSSHVITEGKEGKDKEINRQVDPKNLNADCWLETRANVKNPYGFLSKRWSFKSNSKTAVANPPDLPYD